MATRVRSFSKVNLGLAIGPVRGDGFHDLTTVYQTLALHDVVTVSARRAAATEIVLTTNHPRVPVDGRNTAWKMVARCLERLGLAAEVAIHLEKSLPVQGGLGAGSANAAAALLGLERELGVALGEAERLEVAAEVGSDVPLFLVGGAVLGVGRGEIVSPVEELPATPCVVAVPEVGVSTPQAFRAWDLKAGNTLLVDEGGLTNGIEPDTLTELSLAYSRLLAKVNGEEQGTSGIASTASWPPFISDFLGGQQGKPGSNQVGKVNDLAGSTPLALVRTGIGSSSPSFTNDFETVVFPQYPSLRELKRQLTGSDSGSPALYAALSGSGSALFGLYRSFEDARAAQHRVQAAGAKALLTATLPRADYWRTMFEG